MEQPLFFLGSHNRHMKLMVKPVLTSLYVANWIHRFEELIQVEIVYLNLGFASSYCRL